MDNYVRLILESNGWAENRRFGLAESWISEIEKSGFQCSNCAREILYSFGGIKILEYSPKSCQYFLERDHENVDKKYLLPLKVLDELNQKVSDGRYNGATFTFNAIEAFYDQDLVLDVNFAEKFVGENFFPIGTVDPDGILYATENGHIYILFNDSIFFAECIEDYLNRMFIHQFKLKQIYKVGDLL